MKLFILGNGFDLAHKFPTKYCDFRDWLINAFDANPDIEDFCHPSYSTNYKGLEEYDEKAFAQYFIHLIDDVEPEMATEPKWKCFEENLAIINWDKCLESVNQIYDSDGDKDLWAMEDNSNYFAELCLESNHILQKFFSEWIASINENISNSCHKTKISFKKIFGKDDKYLTFNYTNTLEVLYGIKDVCHIHGDASKLEELIFGHGTPWRQFRKHKVYEDNAFSIFEEVHKSYIKDTQRQIERNEGFFNLIGEVDEIYLFGLSFGDVDAPYFIYIFKICQNLKAIKLNVYKENEYDLVKTKLEKYGATCNINKWVIK